MYEGTIEYVFIIMLIITVHVIPVAAVSWKYLSLNEWLIDWLSSSDIGDDGNKSLTVHTLNIFTQASDAV